MGDNGSTTAIIVYTVSETVIIVVVEDDTNDRRSIGSAAVTHVRSVVYSTNVYYDYELDKPVVYYIISAALGLTED